MLFIFGGRLTAVVILLNSLILLWWLAKNQNWSARHVWLTIFVLNFMIHMLMARIGWAYRYEAYLVAQGILTLFLFWDELFKNILPEAAGSVNKKQLVKVLNSACVLGIILIELVIRAVLAVPVCQEFAVSVYRQQYQMAKFVHDYYAKGTILIDDIGAIAFYNRDIKVVDLIGLASTDVLKARIHNNFNSAYANRLAVNNNCDLIIIYDFVLTRGFDGIPKSWIKVGTWTDKGNRGADETVSFYVLKPENVEHARQCLRQFVLPAQVISSIF
jgi:hypothetical protein